MTEPAVATAPTPEQAAEEILRRRRATGSLHEFMRQAWPIIAGGRPFQDGWHLGAVCEHLEAVYRGEIPNLLLNYPPRMTKSTAISVAFPAYCWIGNPGLQFLYTSYAQNLSVRDSRKCRALIQSKWYQARWGSKFQIVSDQDTKIRFDNDQGGYRIASSVDGQNTGEGGDLVICLPYDAEIITSAGKLKIGEIVGDLLNVRVLAYDHAKNRPVFAEIDEFEANRGRPLVEVRTAWHTLVCTKEHPVYVVGAGYVAADHVVPGDRVITTGVVEAVVSVAELAGCPDEVFNIRVRDHHNYFANGILVHNCDDPNNVKDQSEVMLDSTLDWWVNVMPTRMNDFKTGRVIVVQQRTHERDLSGHILANDTNKEWVHVMLPMEFEAARRCVTVKLPSTNGKRWCDPRKKDGELLSPERVGPKELATLKRRLSERGGEYAIAGQLQQRPAPEAGGIIKKAWFKIWKEPEPPKCDFTLLSLDTALTANKTSAFNVGTTWGVFRDPQNVPNVILLSLWREQCEYPELRARAQRLARDYLDDGPHERKAKRPKKPDIILIESKVTGISLTQDLARAGIFATRYDPDKRGDKVWRVRLVTPILEAGRVWLPGKPPTFDKCRDWADVLLTEALAFPNGATRDIVDTMSQALDHLNTWGFVWHPEDPAPEEKPVDPVAEGEDAFY